MPPRKRPLKAVPTGRIPRTAPRSPIVKKIVDGQLLVQLVASGFTVTEAGEKLNLDQPAAAKLHLAELQRMIADNTELRETLVTQELETMRLLKKTFMRIALTGDDQAAKVVIAVSDRVAKLLGLDAELKIQISNQRIDETITDIVTLLERSESDLPKLLESDVLVPPQTGEEPTG